MAMSLHAATGRMSELLLLRHGKAAAQEEGGPDRDRPLVQRGRHAAQALGQWIAEHGLSPALVLCYKQAGYEA